MILYVLIFLMLLDGEMHLGVKVDDQNKIRTFKSEAACKEELEKAVIELKTKLTGSFEAYCITQKEYYKLVPQKGVSS